MKVDTPPKDITIKGGGEENHVTAHEDGVSMDTSLFDDDAGDSNITTADVLDKDLEPNCEAKEPEVTDQTQEGKILKSFTLFFMLHFMLNILVFGKRVW